MIKNKITTRVVIALTLALLVSVQSTWPISDYSANTYFNHATKAKQQGQIDNAVENYKKAIEVDQHHFEAHFYLANTYFMQGRRDEAIDLYKKATTIRPDSSQTYFNLALALEANGQRENAIQELRKSLEIDPSYLRPRVLLGNIFNQQGKHDQALEQYASALVTDPDNFDANFAIAKIHQNKGAHSQAVENYKRSIKINPHHLQANFNLAFTYSLMGELEKSLETYQKIMVFAPDCLDARYNLAHTLRYLGRVDEAIEQYEIIIKHRKNHAHTHYGYAESLLKAGDLKRGFEHFEWRWKRDSDSRNFAEKLWDGSSDITGKTILVRAEYGQGDTIQFVRCIEFLKKLGATVIAEVQHTLTTLLAGVPHLDKIIVIGDPLPEFDVQVPLMSLPYKLGMTTEETIPNKVPYIDIDQELVQYWKKELSRDGNFKIGICWEGSAYYDSIRGPLSRKAIHLSLFEAIAQIPNVTLYSLQRTSARDQINEVNFEVRDFGPDFDTTNGRFMDTAALSKNLDLVLTIDTSVAHLAAAVGAPTWIILPSVADWRWMQEREDTPWYPNMRLFRQKKYGDWESVFQYIKTELENSIQALSHKSDIVSAEISIGELIDKITILELKEKYISDEQKLKNIRKELEVLRHTRDTKVPKCKELDELTKALYNANQRLWDIEDACRDKERMKEFDDDFIAITRSVYINNDERCALKRKLNVALGSNLVEEKSYAAY